MMHHPYLRTSEKRDHHHVGARDWREDKPLPSSKINRMCLTPTNQDYCDCEQLNTNSQCKGGDVDLTHVIADIEISAARVGELNSGDTEVEAEDRRGLSNTADVSVQCHSLLSFSARCSHRNFENNPAAMQYYTSFQSHEHFMLFLYWGQQLII